MSVPACSSGGGEGPQDTTEGDTVTIEAGMDYGDCANASVVIVPEGRVDVIKEYAKQLVDDGKLLYIQDVAWSKEALGEALSIPLAHSSIHNPMPHVATDTGPGFPRGWVGQCPHPLDGGKLGPVPT